MAFGPPELGSEEREPVHRLHERWGEEPTPRPVPGDRLTVHPDAIRELKPKQPVRPEPNAPLLKRVVRSPYAMSPTAVVRVTGRPARPGSEPLPRIEDPTAGYRELREAMRLENPIRSAPHRPEPRPRPRLLPNQPREEGT